MHVTEVVRVAAEAWHRVKPADDPEFNGCQLSHREKLVAQVEALIRTNSASDDFERAAKEILDSQLKAPESTEAPAVTETAAKTTGKKAKSAKKSK